MIICPAKVPTPTRSGRTQGATPRRRRPIGAIAHDRLRPGRILCRLAARLPRRRIAAVDVQARFGSWPNALRAAGLRPHRRAWTREEIVAALRAWAGEHGRAPHHDEWQAGDREHPPASTVANLFGSWSAALCTADLAPALHGTWTEPEVLDGLRAFVRAHGRPPTRLSVISVVRDQQKHANTAPANPRAPPRPAEPVRPGWRRSRARDGRSGAAAQARRLHRRRRQLPPHAPESGPPSRRTSSTTTRTRAGSHRTCAQPTPSHDQPASRKRSTPLAATRDA